MLRPMKRYPLAAAALAALLSAGPLSAQPPQAPRPPHAPRDTTWALWLTVASGLHASEGGGSGALALTYQKNHVVGGLRAQVAEGPPCTASDCWPDAADVAALIGVATAPGRAWVLSAATGVSIAGTRNSSGFGIPLEVQLLLRPTRYLGVGLYGWANTIGMQSGVGIAVNLGRLR